ncbi:MAG: type II CRISPR-associated endonuclease Cas1 [Cyclobacteriaceae bacterium]|nr:type II CRISPR-associated endonuclease Cas1 [Cyclobacteriaceae bacterium]MCB9447012.1 type II CRISPR-associated endonuclease Cas1 [Flavobacteriales bacterium]
MIKRTLAITSPAYLSLRQKQMVLEKKDEEGEKVEKTVPIEDIGTLVLEDPRVTITHGLIAALLANNVALVTCDEKYHPTGMMLNLCGNTTQAESFRQQADASQPLKKQLWQQVVKAKITNQATVLANAGGEVQMLLEAAKGVKSGDVDNREGMAAMYYWPRLFERYPGFTRGRGAGYPNSLLNYGYAILRAVTARSLVSSGLLPTLGIFHHNRYNQYCLADDMMEPYRPFVDQLVAGMVEEENEVPDVLGKSHKEKLLTVPTLTVVMNGKQRPLMIAASETSASLLRCFNGDQRKLMLPVLE